MPRLWIIKSLAGLASLCVISTAHTATSNTAKQLVLRPSQVGAGYARKVRPDSFAVHNAVTLDMCGYRFTSEQLRKQRAQLDFVKRHAPTISNEVVMYRAYGARKAMQELLSATRNCPDRPVDSRIAGFGPVRYHVRRISVAGLLRGAIALIVNVRGKANGHSLNATSVAIYQREGAVVSGVYADMSAAGALRVAKHAALQSAHVLRDG